MNHILVMRKGTVQYLWMLMLAHFLKIGSYNSQLYTEAEALFQCPFISSYKLPNKIVWMKCCHLRFRWVCYGSRKIGVLSTNKTRQAMYRKNWETETLFINDTLFWLSCRVEFLLLHLVYKKRKWFLCYFQAEVANAVICAVTDYNRIAWWHKLVNQ